MAEQKHFEVTLTRSGAGRDISQRRTLAGLGLKRTHRTVYLKDTPAVRGMLYKVVHLLTITPRTGDLPPSSRAKARAWAARGKGKASPPAKAAIGSGSPAQTH